VSAGPSADPSPLPSDPPLPSEAPAASGPEPSIDPQAVWIPGMHVALVPPVGFVAATSFPGFQDDATGSSIVVAELPGPFSEIADGMTDARIAGEGIEVITREEITQNGLPAVLIEGRQDAGGGRGIFGKVLFITGTEDATALIDCNYPEGDEALRETMVEAVRTTLFDPDRPVDPTDALDFTIEPAPPLKFAGAFANGAVYNTSGQLPAADPLEPALIVAPSLGPAVVGDAEEFAKRRLAQTPQIVDPVVEEVSDVTVAGMDGIEILASAGDDDDPSHTLFVYQLLLVDQEQGGYVLMTGVARRDDRADALPAFRDSASTFAASE
jgi:hypothetical protein